ncbi:hypothetical protein BDQ17DRAFT_1383908 [Cyathus striatus]|nr:hypothetical protein BDQ17DRAFT_1383908 [Cyathus striatus]
MHLCTRGSHTPRTAMWSNRCSTRVHLYVCSFAKLGSTVSLIKPGYDLFFKLVIDPSE